MEEKEKQEFESIIDKTFIELTRIEILIHRTPKTIFRSTQLLLFD